jgi:hypothetical protein
MSLDILALKLEILLPGALEYTLLLTLLISPLSLLSLAMRSVCRCYSRCCPLSTPIGIYDYSRYRVIRYKRRAWGTTTRVTATNGVHSERE